MKHLIYVQGSTTASCVGTSIICCLGAVGLTKSCSKKRPYSTLHSLQRVSPLRKKADECYATELHFCCEGSSNLFFP